MSFYQMFVKAAVACAVVAASFAATAAGASSTSAVNGLSVAVPGGLDSRVRVFAYSPDVVYTLPVTVGMHTHIPLGADEELIEKPKLGELVQWRVSGNERNLYVKALQSNIKTSMTLITDKRVYQFELVSTTAESQRIQKAYFVYPDDEDRMTLAQQSRVDRASALIAAEDSRKKDQELAAEPIDARRLNFYRVEGTKEYERMYAYDDGRHTWMRMPPGIQDLPAVFMVGEDNKLMPVNYTVADRKDKNDRDVIKIERTSPKWLLKIGKAVEVKVTKE